MKSTFISREDNTVKFTMDFTAEEFEQAQIKAYQQSKGQFQIDGFRKGKAPRSIIERHYGEGIFFEDAIDELLRVGYPDALNELDLEVIDSPKAEFSEIGKGKPLTVTIEVPVYPVVEVKDYMGIEVDKVDAVIKDEDVDRELSMMQQRNGRMVVADRPAENGDTVILDYAGFVGEDQFEGGTAENQELKLGSGSFIPGFEEQLVGASAGDKVDVKVTFPEEYHAEDLAGKEAVFHCEIHEVKFEELPELDDEFAKDVSEFDTLEELKKSTYDRLKEAAEVRAENDAKDKVIDQVYQNNKIEAPATMVEDEIDNMIRELDQQMRYQGLSIDQYLGFMQQDMAAFRDQVREDAAKRVATRIVLRSIGAQENVEVSDEDLVKELERMAEVYKMDVENVRKMIGEDNIGYFRKDIALTKVMDLIYNNAKINLISEEEAAARMAEEVKKQAEAGEEKAEEGEDK